MDTLTILNFLQDKSPFLEDTVLRNVVTGIAADESVNVDRGKRVGLEVLKTMSGNTVMDFSFKRSKQAVNMLTKIAVKVDGESIQIDPQLLFQRLVSVANRTVDDISTVFSYELCSHPSSLFDASGLPREAQKPALANAIWSLGECSPTKQPDGDIRFVTDGGSLLQRIPWANIATFGAICSQYSDYLCKRYENTETVIVFDGYSTGASTKDIAHMRRFKGNVSPAVRFIEVTPCKTKKDIFLSNVENKQCFINMLIKHLQQNRFKTVHATNDADVFIVQTAVECARTNPTVLVGEDTDLLVLLCFHASVHNPNIYFTSHTNQAQGKKFKILDITRTKLILGQELCNYLPFVHELTGCDTTSRIFGIGKGPVLKRVRSNAYPKEQADVFCRAGSEVISCLYGGVPLEGLDLLRFRSFTHKVVSNNVYVQVRTSAAASYHSMRVYLQVQQRISQGSELDPCELGWHLSNDKLLPVKTDKQPAPENLLKIIKCNCKVSCDNKRCNGRRHGLVCILGCGECYGTSCSPPLNGTDLREDI